MRRTSASTDFSSARTNTSSAPCKSSGNWDAGTRTFTPAGDPINAVRVITRRSRINGNAAGLFFARVLGFNQVDAETSAIAALGDTGSVCIHALSPNAQRALHVNNGRLVANGCDIQVNSAHWLKALEQSFGRLDAQMIAENMITCIQVMTEGRSDFRISYSHPDVPLDLDPMSFEYLKLDVDRLIPVSAPLSEEKPAFVLPGDENSAVPYLAYDSTSFLGQVMKVFLNRQRGSLHLAQCYEDALAEGLKAMALEARGLTWLPESIVRETVEAGKLVRAGSRDWDVPLEIRIYRYSERLRPTATDLWTFLQGIYTAGSASIIVREDAAAITVPTR